MLQVTINSPLDYCSGLLLTDFPVPFLYMVSRGILLTSSSNHVIPLFNPSGCFLSHSPWMDYKLYGLPFLNHTFLTSFSTSGPLRLLFSLLRIISLRYPRISLPHLLKSLCRCLFLSKLFPDHSIENCKAAFPPALPLFSSPALFFSITWFFDLHYISYSYT